jgi:hypothetical protein
VSLNLKIVKGYKYVDLQQACIEFFFQSLTHC